MKKENPFKKIASNKEVPEEIKEKVMQDVSTAKLLMELGELFSVNYISVIESLFKTKNDDKE